MRRFIESSFCVEKKLCLACRRGGKQFRVTMLQNFELPNGSKPFNCPHGVTDDEIPKPKPPPPLPEWVGQRVHACADCDIEPTRCTMKLYLTKKECSFNRLVTDPTSMCPESMWPPQEE